MKFEDITYTPTEVDNLHMKEIRDFLNEEEIPFSEDKDTTFGLITLNDIKGGKIEIRYIDSYYYPIDNSKRFGDKCKGVEENCFINLFHQNFDKGIRTILIFDFEMEQKNDVVIDGTEIKDYRRQWEVIKNTIRTACGKIHHRFYARDFDVVIVDNSESRPFLMANCFYGYRAATIQLGLKLKKDKQGFKKGTLLFYYSFGANFYGWNSKHPDDQIIEVIRASTKIGCQVIGGISKCIKYFCDNYPTVKIGTHEINVHRIKFYVDASHNDARGMKNSESCFKFISWQGAGFMNRFVHDVDEDGLKGKAGEIFMRRPLFHKVIMKNIGEGNIVSIPNAGTIVYEMTRDDFMEREKAKLTDGKKNDK